ncbi:hypothetical protein [Kitasatospora sp. NPDC086791]|uniref:hypothetical protein n=1 Tax=Kitasatospora sp. NPDC086791 TaxID=3155178 RepID=UPI00343EC46C
METTISALAAQLQPPRPTPAVPVLPALQELLPDRGLRPGTAVRVGGSTALSLALLAAATTEGTWCAAIGCEGLGLVAAAEIGVALDRLHLVERPGEHFEDAAAAYADAAGVLLLRPGRPLSDRSAARLTALARRHGCALVVDGSWPSPQVRLQVTARQWTGVGMGRGRLRGQRVMVEVGGRGAAARGRQVGLWLPDADGRVRLDAPAERLHGARAARPQLAVAR